MNALEILKARHQYIDRVSKAEEVRCWAREFFAGVADFEVTTWGNLRLHGESSKNLIFSVDFDEEVVTIRADVMVRKDWRNRFADLHLRYSDNSAAEIIESIDCRFRELVDTLQVVYLPSDAEVAQ